MSFHRTIPHPGELERLLFHMPWISRNSDSEWTREFARSVVAQSRRPKWAPSPKQLSIMRRLVSEMFVHRNDEGDLQVFEEE